MSKFVSEYIFDSLKTLASTLEKSDWSDDTNKIAERQLQLLNNIYEKVLEDAKTCGRNPKSLAEAERIYNTCKKYIKTMNFNGDFITWCDFIEYFDEHVHRNDQFSNSEKLRRLLAAVTGKAARVLGSWNIHEDNYMKVYNRLREVYNNKYLVGSRIIEEMENRPPIDSTFESLQTLIEEIEKAERSFATMEMPPGHWDQTIVSVVEKRLDERSKESWMGIRHGDPNGMPSLADMVLFLRGRALALPSTSDGARTQWSGYPRMSPHMAPKTEVQQRKTPAKKPMKYIECYICHREAHDDQIECRDCPVLAHFKCLKGAEVVKNKKEAKRWKCNKCLRCGKCHSTNRVGKLKKCVSCFKAYHLKCIPAADPFSNPAADGGNFMCITCLALDQWN